MKARKPETFLMLFVGMVLAVSSRAQTDRSAVTRTMAPQFAVPELVAPSGTANANPNLATVSFKLPQGLDNYRVLEEQAHVSRVATNVTATSHNDVQASLAAGSTLIFTEKEPVKSPGLASSASGGRLFSTYFVKSIAPAQPGRQPNIASGVLSMIADAIPTPWNAASNAYVAHLTVEFMTEDSTPNNSLLPMTVILSGNNVKSIDPRSIELEKVNTGKDVVVTCDQYHTDVQITAHYLTDTNTIPLQLQQLTIPTMIQMILSKPMLFASIAGGLIGGLLRLFKGAKWRILHILHYLGEGAAVGLVTVAMLLAGLLHSQMVELQAQPQLALAFALAAAAGSVGAHFLDKTINHLRGK